MKNICLIICLLALGAQANAYVTQANWRWRNNDGTETNATWRAAENVPITITSIDSILRLRIQLQNNNADPKGINANLQYASAPDGHGDM